MEEVTNVCPIDGADPAICGGPHEEVFTDLGWEVGKMGFVPVGHRISPVPPEEESNRYSVRRQDTSLFQQSPNQAGDAPEEGEAG